MLGSAHVLHFGCFAPTKTKITALCYARQKITLNKIWQEKKKKLTFADKRGSEGEGGWKHGGLWWREVPSLAGYPNVNKLRLILSWLNWKCRLVTQPTVASLEKHVSIFTPVWACLHTFAIILGQIVESSSQLWLADRLYMKACYDVWTFDTLCVVLPSIVDWICLLLK